MWGWPDKVRASVFRFPCWLEERLQAVFFPRKRDRLKPGLRTVAFALPSSPVTLSWVAAGNMRAAAFGSRRAPSLFDSTLRPDSSPPEHAVRGPASTCRFYSSPFTLHPFFGGRGTPDRASSKAARASVAGWKTRTPLRCTAPWRSQKSRPTHHSLECAGNLWRSGRRSRPFRCD